MPPINSKRIYIPFIYVGSVIISMALLRHIVVPMDWVKIDLQQVPSDVSEIYLISKKNNNIYPLNWYLSKVLPFSAEPKYYGEQWDWTVRGTMRKGNVQWVAADSLGVLAKTESRGWILWWIAPENIESPSPIRYLWGGGDEITIRVSGSELSVPAPQDLINKTVNNLENN